jgi:hypothetical protein
MQAIKIITNRQIGDRIQNREDERRLTMTSKEMLVELIERLPEELVRELQHCAEYLSSDPSTKSGPRCLSPIWLLAIQRMKLNTLWTT